MQQSSSFLDFNLSIWKVISNAWTNLAYTSREQPYKKTYTLTQNFKDLGL